MIELQKAIESLQNRLNALPQIGNEQKFKEWKTRTLQTLAHVYGENHTSFKALYSIYGFSGSDRTPLAKGEATELLTGLIEDLNNFGIPKQHIENNKGVNLHVNQQSTQNQTTNVNISIDILFKELETEIGKVGTRELKAILESNEEPEQKKKFFIEKIKSFGSDVASNILANVLTNPQIYQSIGNLL